jgi:hypothetical protein
MSQQLCWRQRRERAEFERLWRRSISSAAARFDALVRIDAEVVFTRGELDRLGAILNAAGHASER